MVHFQIPVNKHPKVSIFCSRHCTIMSPSCSTACMKNLQINFIHFPRFFRKKLEGCIEDSFNYLEIRHETIDAIQQKLKHVEVRQWSDLILYSILTMNVVYNNISVLEACTGVLGEPNKVVCLFLSWTRRDAKEFWQLQISKLTACLISLGLPASGLF